MDNNEYVDRMHNQPYAVGWCSSDAEGAGANFLPFSGAFTLDSVQPENGEHQLLS